MEYITPTQMIEQLKILPITLRRWCQYHKAHLSLTANPDPGKARRFTGRDLEVLRHVRSLRDQGNSTAEINEQLAGLTFPVIEPIDEFIDNDDSKDTAIAPTTAPDALQQAPGVIVALEAMQRRIDAVEQAAQQARQEDKRPRFDTITILGVGICIGLLFAAILIGLAWLYGG